MTTTPDAVFSPGCRETNTMANLYRQLRADASEGHDEWAAGELKRITEKIPPEEMPSMYIDSGTKTNPDQTITMTNGSEIVITPSTAEPFERISYDPPQIHGMPPGPVDLSGIEDAIRCHTMAVMHQKRLKGIVGQWHRGDDVMRPEPLYYPTARGFSLLFDTQEQADSFGEHLDKGDVNLPFEIVFGVYE